MNNFLSAARVWFAAVFCVLMAGLCSAQTNIHEFNIPNQLTAEPRGITYGQDNAYWFVEESSGHIGRINPLVKSNYFSEIIITNKPWCHPNGITAGPDGGLWFTELGNSIVGRVNPFASNYVEYTLPFTFSQPTRTNAQPTSIITGPDDNIWFVEYSINRIGSISPTPATNSNGSVVLLHETSPIRTNSMLTGLTVGPDSNIWFCENNWGIIGRLTNDGSYHGQVTEFTLPDTNCQPLAITSGPDGALWFTEFHSNKVGRITIDGSSVAEFDIPNPNGIHLQPDQIIAGQDGRLWFSLYNGSAVGAINTNGVVTLYPTPTPGGNPSYLATGNTNFGTNDVNIWFSEDYGFGVDNQKIARLLVGEALNLSAPTNVTYTSGTTVSNLIATFQNAYGTNKVAVFWGDGTSNVLRMTNVIAGAFTNTNSLSTTLSILNTAQINTNEFTNGSGAGTFQITASHTYAKASSNYVITLTVLDSGGNFSVAKIPVENLQPAIAPFFDGQIALGDNIYYLQFPDDTVFGYYSIGAYPWVYHFDMGWDYFYDANDNAGGVYLYDLASNHFFYTNPALFPYLYDFTLSAWLYYYPDSSNPQHYTTNPRYFYNFGTGEIITL